MYYIDKLNIKIIYVSGIFFSFIKCDNNIYNKKKMCWLNNILIINLDLEMWCMQQQN